MANRGSIRSQRQGYAPAPLQMRSNNSGLVIVAVVVGVILIGVATLLASLSGGDDSPPLTLAPFGGSTTLSPDATTSLPPTSDIIAVRDDTGTFSINIRGDLQMETAPSIAAGGFTVPRIGSEVAQVIAFLEPNESVCKERVRETINSSLGSAVRISLTGCGIDNLGTKVVLSVQLAEPALVVGIRMQDRGDLAAIQSAALYLLETMQF